MSSLIRRIQKKIAKKQGMTRNKEGFIVNSNGDVVGVGANFNYWPQVSAPTRQKEV